MKLAQSFCAALIMTVAAPAAAEPYEPARGSAERRDILDTIRPWAEYGLGAPVEFVVGTLLVDGDRGFLMLQAQRPGGGEIDLAQTPMVLRDGEPVDLIDGPTLTAFIKRYRGEPWRVDEYAIGATDVWWAGGPYCTHYASLLPKQACQ